jgi:hypothetical protein
MSPSFGDFGVGDTFVEDTAAVELPELVDEAFPSPVEDEMSGAAYLLPGNRDSARSGVDAWTPAIVQ